MSNAKKKGMFWLWAFLLSWVSYLVIYFVNELYSSIISAPEPSELAYTLYNLFGIEGLIFIPVVIVSVGHIVKFFVWMKCSVKRYCTKGLWKFYTIGILIFYRLVVNLGGFNTLRLSVEYETGMSSALYLPYGICVAVDFIFKFWLYSKMVRTLESLPNDE